MSAIQEHLLPLGVTLPSASELAVAGGYFIWLELPPPLRASDIAQLALQEKVKVASGEIFQVQGDPARGRFERNLRICFAWEDERKLVEGIRKLGTVIRNYQG